MGVIKAHTTPTASCPLLLLLLLYPPLLTECHQLHPLEDGCHQGPHHPHSQGEAGTQAAVLQLAESCLAHLHLIVGSRGEGERQGGGTSGCGAAVGSGLSLPLAFRCKQLREGGREGGTEAL